MYLRYLFYSVLALLSTVICYLTNWVVVFFANEEGELPSWCSWWQTWDDSLDSYFYMVEGECVPSFLDYGYIDKYTPVYGTTDELEQLGKKRWFSYLKDGATFSFKERVQRYFCRVLWLMRNNAYGFSFWVLGAFIEGGNFNIKERTADTVIADNGEYFIYKKDGVLCDLGFMRLRWKTFLGWKIDLDNKNTQLAMIAFRPLIVPEF